MAAPISPPRLNAATGGEVRDTALLEIARPTVDIRWQGDDTDIDKTVTDNDSNQIHTNGADLVIGEGAYFDIKVTVPEGITNNLFADVNLPAGLRLDPAYNGGIGYEIISTAGASGVNGFSTNNELTASFAGTGVNTAAAGNLTAHRPAVCRGARSAVRASVLASAWEPSATVQTTTPRTTASSCASAWRPRTWFPTSRMSR